MGVNSGFYIALLVVHIAATVALFGPSLLFPSIMRKALELRGSNGASLVKTMLVANGPMAVGALVVLILAGVGLVIVSDGAWEFGDRWISAGFTIALALLGVGWLLVQPAIKKLESALANNESDEKLNTLKAQISMSTGLIHLGMVVAIVLMVWKP